MGWAWRLTIDLGDDRLRGGDGQAVFDHAVEVEADGCGDFRSCCVHRRAGRHATGQVGDMGGEGVAHVLNDDGVLQCGSVD